MNLFTSCLVLACVAISSSSPSARADVRPPPLAVPADTTPPAAKLWLAASINAMKSNDLELAAKLCDPRGYRDNLVGGSGNPLDSLFAQGARKGWHLVADHRLTRGVHGSSGGTREGVILRASVRDNKSGKSFDEIYLLLVKTTDAVGAKRWLALGAGEDRAQVDALAARFVNDQPLRPPVDQPEAPVPK